MNAPLRDRIVGFVLTAVAMAWSATAYLTIPVGDDSGIGPRAFPLFLGLVLLGLSLLLFVRSFARAREAIAADDDEGYGIADKPDGDINARELPVAAGLFLILIAYGLLMEGLGFLLATPLIIAATMTGLLRQRRLVLIFSLAIAITLGCWIVFGKLLGIYLPQGSWISAGVYL